MSRLPVASSRLPNIEAIVKDYGIGMIFDETDPLDMARVINIMLEQENLTRFNDAVNKAAQELCWETEGQKYVDFIVH